VKKKKIKKKYTNLRYKRTDYYIENEEKNIYLHTWLSRPNVISMKKKMIAQNVDPGRLFRASGYITNTKPAPV
jgi:hypothetical protein